MSSVPNPPFNSGSKSGVSLAARLSVIVAGVLVVGALSTGFSVYHVVQNSLNQNLRIRLNDVLTFMQGSVDQDGNVIDFKPVGPKNAMREHWRVTTGNGQALWTNPGWDEREQPAEEQSIKVVLGNPKLPVSRSPLKETHLSANGGKPRPAYELPAGEHVELTLSASIPRAQADDTLRNLAIWLWGGGVLTVALLALALIYLIRRQLAPLGVMAAQVAVITPEQMRPIPGSGGGAECAGLRAALNNMLARLREGLASERRFSYVAAHELRTPLARLVKEIEVALCQGRQAEEYREMLEQLQSDIGRLKRLTTGLLNLTAAQEVDPDKPVQVNLKELVRQAMIDAGMEDSPAGALVPDVQIVCAPELMTAAIRNVLDNAACYAPDSEPVIGVEDAGLKRLTLFVRDYGPGVPEEAREMIFEPFTRLDDVSTVDEHGDGSFGIGLAIAREIMRSHGGDLVCDKRGDGQPGAEFRFLIQTGL